MSSTRRASGNGPLRQERFCSSPEFERGLMANLVAKRCRVLERAEDRALVWYLQWHSHRDGGLQRFAAELCERFPERLATPAMQRLGTKPGQIYRASQVKEVRDEIQDAPFAFRLKGEMDDIALMTSPDGPFHAMDRDPDNWPDGDPGNWMDPRELERKRVRSLAAARAEADGQPATYEASRFVAHCRAAATEHLERHLGELCLDPAAALVDGAPWYFPGLVSTLRELFAAHVAQHRAATHNTAIGRQVFEALEYSRATGAMVLIDGLPRRGKSHAAKVWAEQNPGAVRYVEVPATNDDFAFYRALAECLGVSINLKSKAQELRGRIEETLQSSKLMLILDEAHYLWPQSHYRHTTPGRVNWLMVSLVNQGVPVALVTTPQFFLSQKEIEDRTHWTSEQFTGRIGHYEKLPESLTTADLRLVAKAMLPEGDARTIDSLADYAQGSKKYLGAIEAAVPRARYNARRAGRDRVVFADVKQAILESVIPSDNALSAALQPAERRFRRRAGHGAAMPLQSPVVSSDTGSGLEMSGARPLAATLPASRAIRPAAAGSRAMELESRELVPAG